MKLANYAIFALGALPQLCAGQGSLRISSELAQMPNDADKRAASLDSLFEKLDHRHLEALKRQNQASKATLSDDGKTALLQDGRTALLQGQIKGLEESVTGLKAAVDSQSIAPSAKKANIALKSIEALSQSVTQIKDCAKGNNCSGKAIADTVFAVLGAVGFGVGVAFPPAGAVIEVVAALGSFIASFFGDDPVRKMPGLDAAAVEAAAFRAVQRNADTNAFAQFADFEEVLRGATKFNSNALVDLETAIKKGADTNSVDDIVAEWHNQHHNFNLESMIDHLRDMGREHCNAFGDITGSKRDTFNKWIHSSMKTCKLECCLKTDQKGRDNLNKCKENMATAKTNYDHINNFGAHYIKVAIMMVAYWASTVSILSKHSTCGNDMVNVMCQCNIAFKTLKCEVTESVFKHAQALQETLATIPETCENPSPNANVWPWNQQCADWPGKCTFECLVLTTQADQENIVNGCEGGGCKMLITEQCFEADVKSNCAEVVRNGKDESNKSTAFYGGIIGFWIGKSTKPKGVGCNQAAYQTNAAATDCSMFAIPSYSIHIPECQALFESAKNFGIADGDEVGTLQNDSVKGGATEPAPSNALCGPGELGSKIASWDEAVCFCKSKGKKLASLKDICPDGKNGKVSFGAKNGEDQWSPFSDYKNGWVQVGDRVHPVCHTYSELSPTLSTPVWGVDGQKNAEEGNYVLCAPPGQAPILSPEDAWSYLGYNRNDGACWEETIRGACSVEEARTLMDGHQCKAAKKLDWSDGWSTSSGGCWNKGLQKGPCTSRGFSYDEKEQCFWQDELNQGCVCD